MKADLCDFTDAIELPETADRLTESTPADEAVSFSGPASEAESMLVMASDPSRDGTMDSAGASAAEVSSSTNPHPVRTIAFNVVRFASVLIGAGLLLRTGAAEQALSAIEEEKPQPSRPVTKRLVLPQPAFGQGGQTGVADPARLAVPHATFASAGSSSSNADKQQAAGSNPALKASVTKAAPAFADFDSEFGESAPAKAASAQPSRLAAVSADAEPVRPAARVAPALMQTVSASSMAAPVAPATASAAAPKASASSRQAELAPSVASEPSILSPTRRSTASGLLAPVKVVSRPAIASGIAPVAAPAARPVPVSNLASGQPQLAQPAPRTAPAGAPVAAPAALAGVAPAASGAPGTAAPVKISLAPPVMKPGPRTTLLTSDIRTVMRRPASAWDYAEALPPELTGRPGQRSASVQPQSPQPQRVASVQPSAVAQPVAAQGAPAPATGALSAPDERVVAQSQASAQDLAKPQSGRPLAQLDLPSAAKHDATADLRSGQRLAKVAPHTHSGPELAAKPAKADGKHGLVAKRPADDKRKADELETAAVGGSAPIQASGQPSAQAGTTASADAALRTVGYDGSSGTSAQLADASGTASGPEGSGLSLRDRLPRPAF